MTYVSPQRRLFCANLNTLTKCAFYEVLEPVRAQALVRRIEFCYMLKHGSWLNVSESELSAMTRQDLPGRRIGDMETLRSEIAVWSTDVNHRQRGVDRQMDINDARGKLKSLFPDIKCDKALVLSAGSQSERIPVPHAHHHHAESARDSAL